MDKNIDVLTPALPPYAVVVSCVALGFEKPQDSPWKQIPRSSPYFAKEILHCYCESPTPLGSKGAHPKGGQEVEIIVHRCLFNSNGGSDIFRIGQCPACHTIYWSED